MPSGTWAKALVVYGDTLNPEMCNVLWWRPSGSVSVMNGQIACDELAQLLDTNINGPLCDCLPNNCNYHYMKVEVNISGSVFTAQNGDNAASGNVSSEAHPENVAVVMRKHTGQPGKSGRGRWYVGCVPETFSSDGRLTNTAVSAYNALYSAYRGDQVGSSITWGSYLYSKKDDALYAIGAGVVDVYTKSQRGRLYRPL